MSKMKTTLLRSEVRIRTYQFTFLEPGDKGTSVDGGGGIWSLLNQEPNINFMHVLKTSIYDVRTPTFIVVF